MHFTPVIIQWNKIGNHQERLGDVQQGRADQFHGQELVQGVELHELQAAVAEDLVAADHAERLFHHAVGAAVAVLVRVAEQLVAPAQQTEIDAPRIHAHAGDTVARLAARGPQTLANMGPLSEEVPIEVAIDLHRAIFEAVNLFELQTLAVEQPQHGPPAGGAHVHRQIRLLSHYAPIA